MPYSPLPRLGRSLRLGFCFCLALLLSLIQLPDMSLMGSGNAQAMEPGQQVQQGIVLYEAGDYLGALSPWQRALEGYQSRGDRQNAAIVEENLARTSLQLGQVSEAVRYWGEAAELHQQLNNDQSLGRALTEQAQAYSQLGQHRRALALLCSSLSIDSCAEGSAMSLAQATEDGLGQAAAQGSMAEAHRLLGEYDTAKAILEAAQPIISNLNNSAFQASVLSSLGNIEVGRAKAFYRKGNALERIGDKRLASKVRIQATAADEVAQSYFEDTLVLAQQSGNASEQLKGLSSLIPIHRRLNQSTLADQRWREAQALLKPMPRSQAKAFAAINLAGLADSTQTQLSSSLGLQCPSRESRNQAQGLLEESLAIADHIQNLRVKSFAQGHLGYLAECNGQLDRALALTEEARWAADQDRQAQDSLYLWDWQIGRVLREQGQDAAAVKAYGQAIEHLEDIRSDILTANQDLQFDFRDTVEPIYRSLAALNLEQIPASEVLSQSNEQFKTIDTTLQTVDSLKLSELQNYFGSDCVIAPVSRSVIDVQQGAVDTAIVNTLTFPERTAVIYSFPDGATQVEWIELSEAEIREKTIGFRRDLEISVYDPFSNASAQKLYAWLVKPFEAKLKESQVDTLVFVNDGILRSVPMAALHDSEQFLIQNYAVATTPSLQLTDPQPLQRKNLSVLALGFSEGAETETQDFDPLPSVVNEMTAVEGTLPGKTLLNQDFTKASLEKELTQSSYPILHLATHGEFGIEPQDNFLATGTGEKMTISELDQLIRKFSKTTEPIELLALTACQTAIGDDRAALGLAGVAVRAGARSAIASLWTVFDDSTAEVMEGFYGELINPAMSKAKALQRAQVALIDQGGEAAKPARWAPYILIGNWL